MMIFWIFAAILTFFAALCVVLPVTRNNSEAVSVIEFDKAIYKARLSEIESDLKLERITEEEAKAAIAEEGRKLIALDSDQSQHNRFGQIGKIMPKIVSVIGVLVLPAAAMTIYLMLGNPSSPDQSLQSRLQTPPENQSITDLVSRAEAHLSKNPQDVQGWSVLAPVYSRMERFTDAQNAWANVYRLAPQTPEIRATLAESIVATANGIVTADAKKLFQEELAINQSSAKARFYLAMALGQEGKHREAVAAWQELIRGGNNQSPWMQAANAFLAESAKIANIKIEPNPMTADAGIPAAPGPNAEQVAAASQMDEQDRNQMILGMVERLSQKLVENPDDKDGWQRLIRAYTVLGKKDEALGAIEKAKATFANDAEFAGVLDGVAQSLK